ncbi:MAG: ATP-dependent zinc metalloprotease FtsH [Spirochaetales bacterium]|nr:ATP-dependent zinc metalloprotease FtsH [Spirochaetales bacterium]MCF7937718.1 ATP-dependent zinc metalloprotease FtsH [Spirochaetales bacterium]
MNNRQNNDTPVNGNQNNDDQNRNDNQNSDQGPFPGGEGGKDDQGNQQNNGQGGPGGPGGPLGGPGGSNNLRRWTMIIIPLLFLMPLLTTIISNNTNQLTVSYTEFRRQVEQGNVQEVVIKGHSIEGQYNQSVQTQSGQPASGRSFITYVPAFGDPELISLLQNNGVTVYTQPEDVSFMNIFLNMLPILLLVWIVFTFYRNMRSQGKGIFSVGQNKAKLYDKAEHTKTTFDDVAGLEGAKTEVTEIVDYLKNPKSYESLGAKTPKGILLVGPPGTGKTLVARAIAGEADVPFYSMSGSDFMEMFVGVGASRVRNLFIDAKKKAPSIIFIDEIDSIGRHRGAGLGGGHDEREQTLNQLLSELDGFEPNESTIVLAATNRPDILDPALLRPGRFDRRVLINLPTVKDREEILAIHARKRPFDEEVDLAKIAQGTPGFSGADLENLLNEASILAARERHESIGMAQVWEARDKIILGLERRNISMSEEEKKIVAYHEAGHALLAAMLPNTDPVYKVSIIPRDMAMGVTMQLPARDKYLYSREYLEDRLAVMLAGRCSEELIFDSITSGAENDFRESTKLARQMVSAWGMSEKLGPLASSGEQRNVFLGEELSRGREFSEETAQVIDSEIQRFLNESYERAKSTLEENRSKLEKLADTLLEKEQLSADEVLDLLGLEKKKDEESHGENS